MNSKSKTTAEKYAESGISINKMIREANRLSDSLDNAEEIREMSIRIQHGFYNNDICKVQHNRIKAILNHLGDGDSNTVDYQCALSEVTKNLYCQRGYGVFS